MFVTSVCDFEWNVRAPFIFIKKKKKNHFETKAWLCCCKTLPFPKINWEHNTKLHSLGSIEITKSVRKLCFIKSIRALKYYYCVPSVEYWSDYLFTVKIQTFSQQYQILALIGRIADFDISRKKKSG